VFLAPAAAAHDVLVSSDPEDGAELENPTSLTLTFNNDPLDVNPVISISGPDGQEKALELTPVVDGRDVYVEFSDLEPGEYAVAWRVVSSDGHPIEGNQSFTVLPSADAPDPADEEPADEEPATDPDESVSSDDEPADAGDEPTAAGDEPTETAEQSEESGLPWFVWGLITLGVLIAIGLIYLIKTRPKPVEKTSDEAPSKN